MASSRELNVDQGVANLDDDDVRGDGKKKKFKPLSAVRKFFGKKRKKDEGGVVAVKAQSTTALHYGDGRNPDDEDDDGGFKSHQKSISLAGTRSISEDSVFSPEPRDASICAFPKAAVSEESLPKSSFQSELLSKLHKRRSQYSDDDHDDGLPRSPVPPLTTADVIMGGPLKPSAPRNKSSNRDSDQSLISVDSSENEEEDLFRAKWKSSVPSRKSASNPSRSDGKMESLDFNNIEKTEVLKSFAAKDRISVKPTGRKASRQSKKKKESPSPQSLPSLNEESPTRARPDQEIKSNLQTGKSDENPAHPTSGDKAFGLSSSTGHSSLTSVGTSSPTKPSAVRSSSSPLKSPTLPTATTKLMSQSQRQAEPSSLATSSVSSYSSSQKNPGSISSSSIGLPTAGANEKLNKDAIFVSEKEDMGDGGSKSHTSNAFANKFYQRDSEEHKTKVDISSRMSNFQSSSSTTLEKTSLKVSDTTSGVSISPKEDYKLRRQSRSKTLPAASDDQSPSGIQRASSHRAPGLSSTLVLKQTESSVATQHTFSTATTTTAAASVSTNTSAAAGATTIETPSVKKLDPSRFTSAPSKPSWVNASWKKKEDQLGDLSDGERGTKGVAVEQSPAMPKSDVDSVKPESSGAMKQIPAVTKVGGTTSGQRPLISSSNYLENKRGSFEIASSKGRESSDHIAKKGDDLVHDGSMKRPSIDISSTRRESIEINISELNSVKALSSSFGNSSKWDNSMKTKSQREPTKVKVPFTSAASVEGTKSNVGSVLPAAGSGKVTSSGSDQEGATSAAVSNTSSSGLSHSRGGSVKTSPTKSVDVKSAFANRGSSVKIPPSFYSASSGSPSKFTPANLASSSLSKSELTSTKTESSGATLSSTTSSSTSSSSSSAVHPSSVLASQNNSHTSSNLHAVTSSSSTSANTKSFPSAYNSSKPPTNPSLASKSHSNPNQPNPPLPNPTPANSSGVKSFASSSSVAVSSIPLTGGKSSSASTASFASNNVPSASTSSVCAVSPSIAASSTSSSSSSSSSTSRASPIRAHSSFTASAAFRPQLSSSTPSHSSSITKSPSLRTTASTSAPVDKTKAEEKDKSTTSTNVPAWRANLAKKEMKIEIIEKAPSSSLSSSSSSSSTPSQNKIENLKKASDNSRVAEASKKSDPGGANDRASNRSSKVLDMVKNFQNLQVS